jgi:cytochrome c-type biogenesis protein CcmH
MNSTIILVSLVLTIIAASCLAIYLASDAVVLMIQNFGVSRTKFAASGIAAALVCVALLVTWWYASMSREKAQIGNGEPAPPITQAPSNGPQAGDLNQLVERLEARLKREPQDAQGQALFARTMMELSRYPAAASAYEKAVAALPDDATLHIERASAEYMANDQKWTPVAVAAIARGLNLAPNHPEALWLAGKERFENKDYAKAVRHWEALERAVPAESDHAKDIKTSLVEARALRDGHDPAAALANAGVSASALLPAAAPLAGSPKDAIAAELKATLMAMDGRAVPATSPASLLPGISGVVSLAASLKERAAPGDNVFIFARNADTAQAGMPLAILRHRVADLPVRFDLSDNNAMSPEAKLSTAAKVIITARISKSGDARAQLGDLEGASVPIPLGTEKLGIVINRAR